MRLRAHSEFVKSLEDRNGFIKSLSNVDRRLGGAGSTKAYLDEANIQEAVRFPEAGQSSSQLTSPESATATATNSPLNRWDEIRKANARGSAQNSSWDALRQNHERNRVAGTNEASSFTESDRAQEQANFDAMLEAERRRGSS
jgi:hypothetical protein